MVHKKDPTAGCQHEGREREFRQGEQQVKTVTASILGRRSNVKPVQSVPVAKFVDYHGALAGSSGSVNAFIAGGTNIPSTPTPSLGRYYPSRDCSIGHRIAYQRVKLDGIVD